MMKLKLAALLAAGAITLGSGAAMAQERPAPKAEHPRAPHHDPFDLNNDGFVTKDEWMKAAAARFDRFDVSKDGKISREEMRFGHFEEMQHMRHMRGGHGWHHGGPHGGPGGMGQRDPGGPGHRMGPPPPPPTDAPTPPAN